MNNCITLADIDEAVTCADLDNVGGIAAIYVAYQNDISTFPEYPTLNGGSPIDYLQAGEWEGEFTMISGKKFVKIEIKDESGELTFAEQGENGAMSVLATLIIALSKITGINAGFVNAMRNRKLVIGVEDANGTKYILGDKKLPCRMVAGDNTTTGKARTDVNQMNLQFTYTSPRLLTFDGTFPVTASTGE